MDLSPEARARHMIPISHRLRDKAWQAANPDAYEAMVAFSASGPFAGEARRELGARLQLEARAGHDVWDRLPSLRLPVLIAAGKYDGIARPETQLNLAMQIRGSTLRFFEGGHMFMIQDRAAIPAMIEFLKA
jgi:3-oxoadipate enol-lactonase